MEAAAFDARELAVDPGELQQRHRKANGKPEHEIGAGRTAVGDFPFPIVQTSLALDARDVHIEAIVEPQFLATLAQRIGAKQKLLAVPPNTLDQS